MHGFEMSSPTKTLLALEAKASRVGSDSEPVCSGW
jgi:hypothetical protein